MSSTTSDLLSRFVEERHAKPVEMDLESWISENPLPCFCEEKYEGIRVFLFKSGDSLVLSSKMGGVYTPGGNPTVFGNVPEFTHAPHRFILDGEYVSHDGLHLFDALQIDDRDIRSDPQEKRKEILHEILEGTVLEVPVVSAVSIGEIERFKDEIISRGGTGLIVKNPSSFYGQVGSWLKLKRFDTVDLFVIEKSVTSLSSPSLSAGVYDSQGRVVNLGNISSFVEKVNPTKIKVGSVVEVRFRDITEKNDLVDAFVLRIRHDKTPNECSFDEVTRFVKRRQRRQEAVD